MANDKIAFTQEERGYKVTAWWGDSPNARVEILKDGKPYKEFEYPAYKIFNIAAHFGDIVDDFETGMNIASSPF